MWYGLMAHVSSCFRMMVAFEATDLNWSTKQLANSIMMLGMFTWYGLDSLVFIKMSLTRAVTLHCFMTICTHSFTPCVAITAGYFNKITHCIIGCPSCLKLWLWSILES